MAAKWLRMLVPWRGGWTPRGKEPRPGRSAGVVVVGGYWRFDWWTGYITGVRVELPVLWVLKGSVRFLDLIFGLDKEHEWRFNTYSQEMSQS